jgi:hypothetical protein
VEVPQLAVTDAATLAKVAMPLLGEVAKPPSPAEAKTPPLSVMKIPSLSVVKIPRLSVKNTLQYCCQSGYGATGWLGYTNTGSVATYDARAKCSLDQM